MESTLKSASCIRVIGARQHNLKNIDVVIPRGELTVITGLSGAGKSSLAFDTIYAEGQRKYVESLSAYARQFLEQLQKPDVDRIEGLSPTIAIEQRGAMAGPRSTVSTSTEIHDFLRVLFARAGTPRCWRCDRPIERQTTEQVVDAVLSAPDGQRIMVLAPLVERRRGKHASVLQRVAKEGFVRVRVDGEIHSLDEVPELKMLSERSDARQIRLWTLPVGENDGAPYSIVAEETTALQAATWAGEGTKWGGPDGWWF